MPSKTKLPAPKRTRQSGGRPTGDACAASPAAFDEVRRIVDGYLKARGYQPTYTEIGDRLGRSRHWVRDVVAAGARAGWVRNDGNRALYFLARRRRKAQ